ncbi:MAG: cell division site-positioning protein MapZ family protein [Lactococcus raffinolactis]
MAKKKKKTAYKEKTLAMKDAENLTVEQVSAKSDELETENLTKESSLDKYIRQHRSDIESAKKERQLKAAAASESLDKLVKTAREAATADSDDSEKEISSEKEDVVENKTTLSDTAVEEVSVQSETVSEIAPVSEPEIPEVTEPVEEAIEPDFPEIQGSFDTVVLAADDDDEQSPGSPALSEKSDEPVSQVDPDPVVTPFASKVSEPTTKVKTPVKVPEMIAPQPASAKQEWSIGASEQETKSHKKPLIIGVCALLLLAVGGTVWYQVDQSNQKQAAQTAKSEAKKSEEAKKTAAFNKVYATFFVDEKQTKLKNDQFDNFDKLTSELDKLKDQSDYKTLKAKVDELMSEISAIKAMNGNFDKAIIKDGVLDKTAQVRNDAKLSYTATENTALNTLLKDAVTHGQAQQKANASTAAANASTSAANAQPVAPSAPANTTTTPQQGGATTATAGSATGPISSGYGLSTAQYQAQYPNVTIVTSNSRVPVDPNADLSDPAYAWAPGIRELVLQKCRERGYISGDNYILLPASIQKGNGYYNLYKSDGTYLVSINCKTGYFVGNATGHADDLDY